MNRGKHPTINNTECKSWNNQNRISVGIAADDSLKELQ